MASEDSPRQDCIGLSGFSWITYYDILCCIYNIHALNSSKLCRNACNFSRAQQAAVQNVYSWVHRDEDRSRARLEELGLPAPLPADISEIPLLQNVEAAGVLVDDDGKAAAEAICLVESESVLSESAQLRPTEGKWRTHLKTQGVQFDLD